LYSPAILWANRLVKFEDKIPPLGEVVLPRSTAGVGGSK